MIALALLLAVTPGRELIGIYNSWGAFRDAGQHRCFAIARSLVRSGVRGEGFASIGTWPDKRLRASFYVRLSHPIERSARVTLTVGERRFVLAASGVDAWAADAASDRAIVAALRGARAMSVEAVARSGQPFADVYPLAGAATAIDAAVLGCIN